MTVLNPYKTFIHKSRYAKYLPGQQRREDWPETVGRYCDFWATKYPEFPRDLAFNAIVNHEVMPSMRAMMSSGKALDAHHMAGYNCSYLAIDDVRAFDETLYILMCGTGVGFSVERQEIAKLPTVAEEFFDTDTTIVVRDSKMGWATALREYISMLYAGKIPKVDPSKIRPKGSVLKTFGGRSSGPEPFLQMLRNITKIFVKAAGRKLSSIEAHDVVCFIADCVVVGGVRRSALICLSNLTDERMRTAKSGNWWEAAGQRQLANISTAFTEKPEIGIFMKEWLALYESKSGERGIFSRVAAEKKVAATGRREVGWSWGTNPCGEIILRPNGLCNLTEAIAREDSDEADLMRKVEIAAILGTFQATLTKFKYVRKVWQTNAEAERLLGVSITGIMDNGPLRTNGPERRALIERLKAHVLATNRKWADILGIPHSVATTTVKPSGTVSQLVDSSSGFHARFSKFHIRNVRNSKNDPVSAFMVSQGVPYEEDATNSSNWVFSFPMKAPPGAVLASEQTAAEQLDQYLEFQEHWCEHNVSSTIYVREHEWMEIGARVYKDFDRIVGVSFLPYDDHTYRQAPYIEMTEEEYEAKAAAFPNVDWSQFVETEDNSENVKELACVAGYCSI